jgi:RNA polymerase sigma factor (sigma-70 family)
MLTDHLRNYPHLTAAEERECSVAWQQRHDLAARNRLVESILPWACKIATKYQGHGLDLDELMSLASWGAIDAAEHLDPDKGRLTTVAYHWIKRRILAALRTETTVVRLPHGTLKSPSTAPAAIRVLEGIYSLDAPLGGGSGPESTIAGILPAPPCDPAEIALEHEEQARVDAQRAELRAAIGKLPERDGQIMAARLRGVTLEEIGRLFGLTRERIRQIQSQALREVAWTMTGINVPTIRQQAYARRAAETAGA